MTGCGEVKINVGLLLLDLSLLLFSGLCTLAWILNTADELKPNLVIDTYTFSQNIFNFANFN